MTPTLSFTSKKITPEMLQRALGALIGSAVGDALGAPFEFGPAGAYSQRFGQPVLTGVGEMTGGGSFSWAPGEFTDDTQMMLALGESLLAHQGLNLDDLWERFTCWSSAASDVGIATSRALSASDRHQALLNEQANPSRSASNGALMRTWAIPLAFLGHDTADVMKAAFTQASMTHFDPAAGWGAAIGSELCRRAILGADPITQIDEVLSYVPAEHRGRFADVLRPDWQPNTAGDPSNGSVWTCLAQAIWAIRHNDTFENVLIAVIDLGGDTDTVACVAGAIAGAKFSIQGIPGRWLTYVHGSLLTPEGRHEYDYLGLQNMARQLIGRRDATLSALDGPIKPTRVDENFALFGADVAGVLDCDPDFVPISFCLTAGRLKKHAIRREYYLRDEEGDQNTDIFSVVCDAVRSINALLAQGHNVVVHCQGGRSRTGLILKAWAMCQYDLDDQEAHEWILQRWPHYRTWNETFLDFLKYEWAVKRHQCLPHQHQP